MPRETIPTHDGKVSVGWTKDRDVQVGVELSPHVTFNGDLPTGATVTAGGPSAWATLDRHGLNRLIRSLRKARDAAYGADE